MLEHIDRAKLQSALGDSMDPEQYLAGWLAVTAQLSTRKPLDLASFERAVLECAMLMVSPAADEVTIVARYDKNNNIYRCGALLTHRGMITLMRRSPEILDIEPVLVHNSDKYSFTNGVLYHEYDPFDENRTIESERDIKGGYVKITYRDGRVKYHFVPASKIAKARACAEKDIIWKTWFAEMALKTLIRDAFARSAVAVDLAVQRRMFRAIQMEDAWLGNDPTRPAVLVESGKKPTEPKEPQFEELPRPALDEATDRYNEEFETYCDRLRACDTIQALSECMNAIARSQLPFSIKGELKAVFQQRLNELKEVRKNAAGKKEQGHSANNGDQS